MPSEGPKTIPKVKSLKMKNTLFYSIVAAGLLFPNAEARSVYWTGGGDGLTWNDGANWGGTPPSDGDDVYVGATTVNDIPGISLKSLTFTGVGGWTLSGSTISLQAGAWGGLATESGVTEACTISAPLVLEEGEVWFMPAVSRKGVTITGSISGPGRLVKTGYGNLVLKAENTYTGGTYYTNGVLYVQSPGALGTGQLDSLHTDTSRRTVGHEQELRVVALDGLIAGVVLLAFPVLGLDAVVDGLLLERFQLEGGDDSVLARGTVAGGGPRTVLLNILVGPAGLVVVNHNLLHHLADDTIGEDGDRVAVLEGQVEAQLHEVVHLLHRRGGQRDETVVAVAAALGGLEIVGLGGLDGAETRTAAHDVDAQSGQLGACNIGKTLLHQGESRGGGGGHHSFSGSGTGIHHIDGGQLALGLQHNHSGRQIWSLGH